MTARRSTTHAPAEDRWGGDIATMHRLPEPTTIMLAQALCLIAQSGRETIGAATMWMLLQDAGIRCDGWSACHALEELGLLLPSDHSAELGRVWIVPESLRSATLAARISARVWLKAVAEYVQAGYEARDALL
jgi:hypothetical protein